MAEILNTALYLAMGLLLVILVFGVVNLVRTDGQQRSRSNQLMRLRVLVQFIAILILVALGFVSGIISF